jgi:hypothetical protein
MDGMRFPVRSIKAIQTQIAHKSQNYLITGHLLYFQGKDGVLQRIIRKGETSHLLYEFHDGFCEGHFLRQITTTKKFTSRLILAHPFQGHS